MQNKDFNNPLIVELTPHDLATMARQQIGFHKERFNQMPNVLITGLGVLTVMSSANLVKENENGAFWFDDKLRVVLNPNDEAGLAVGYSFLYDKQGILV